MRIEFSRHALDQLKNRPRITRRMVVETVTSPDEVVASYRGRLLYRKALETGALEVVVKEEDNKHIIITEYLLEPEP